MKKKLFAIILCIMLVITFIPTTTLAYDSGLYNDNDFYKMQAFLNQMSDDGVNTNGQLLSPSYNPDDPSMSSWGAGITWTDDASNKRISAISWSYTGIKGNLDLSGFTSLTSVVIVVTSLNTIDVSGDSALSYLNIKYNDHLSAATGTAGLASLDTVMCSNCPNLTSLNVSGCTSLKLLDARECSIDTLDITGCTLLETLFVYSNKLTQLDVSSFGALTELYCEDNPEMASLTIQGASNLEDVRCSGGKIGTLNASGLTKLVKLDCSDNEIETLDLTGDTALEELRCNNNKIGSLSVAGFSNLTILDCSYNNLTAIDGISDTAISELSCSSNEIEELDLSSMSDLYVLLCDNNKIQSLDLSDKTALAVVACNNNKLTSLNTAGDTALLMFVCSDNLLTTLDLSDSTDILYIVATANKFTSIKAMFSDKSVTLNVKGDGYAELYRVDEEFYANAIPNSGLNFIDWTQSGTEVSTSQKYDLTEDMEYNLTANFGYTLTFDKNGGDTDASPLTETVVSGEKATEPATEPTKAGLVFDGWYKEAGCINEWNFDTDTVDANTTLFAKWSELALTMSAADGKMFTGGRITITPNGAGGTWDFDTSFLSRNGNVFTALKAGTVTVRYTLGNVTKSVDIIISQAAMPQTGQNFTVVYLLLTAAAAAGVTLIIVAKRRKV
ncbi:MAG: hypothetical protein GYA50_10140 [Eubacteriaceae bacterium]|nr:hypothetical protein [Eubacteriaceae bacterium]